MGLFLLAVAACSWTEPTDYTDALRVADTLSLDPPDDLPGIDVCQGVQLEIPVEADLVGEDALIQLQEAGTIVAALTGVVTGNTSGGRLVFTIPGGLVEPESGQHGTLAAHIVFVQSLRSGSLDLPLSDITPELPVDADGDGFTGTQSEIHCRVLPPGDCDDSNQAVSPEGTEVPANGVDENCGGGDACFIDHDQDGHGTTLVLDVLDLVGGCDEDPRYSALTGDCDDGNPAKHPENPEVCDGLDNDCSGELDAAELDQDGDGYASCAGDCDDLEPLLHPMAFERCDGLDSDCDGTPGPEELDIDQDGHVRCTLDAALPAAASALGDDCNDHHAASYPGAPAVCDGYDNGCEGALDPSEQDADGDGFVLCGPLTGGRADLLAGHDCNDEQPSVHPDAVEFCDGFDNGCTGLPADQNALGFSAFPVGGTPLDTALSSEAFAAVQEPGGRIHLCTDFVGSGSLISEAPVEVIGFPAHDPPEIQGSLSLEGDWTMRDLVFGGGPGTDLNGLSFGGAIFVDLDGQLTLEDVLIDCGHHAVHNGGAVWTEGDLVIARSIVQNCAAQVRGGALSVQGDLTATDVLFSNNRAFQAGGVFVGGEARLERVQFVGNTAMSSDPHSALPAGGGAMLVGESTLVDVHFTGNVAEIGGGLYTGLDSFGSMHRVTFEENAALLRGGGLYLHGSSTTLGDAWAVTAPVFRQNLAAEAGGGMSHITGAMSVTDGLFEGNVVSSSVGAGGGLEVFGSARARLTHTTFLENRSGRLGGGIISHGPLSLEDLEFVRNSTAGTAGHGGALYALAEVTATDVLMEDNHASSSRHLRLNAYAQISDLQIVTAVGQPASEYTATLVGNIEGERWTVNASGDARATFQIVAPGSLSCADCALPGTTVNYPVLPSPVPSGPLVFCSVPHGCTVLP